MIMGRTVKLGYLGLSGRGRSVLGLLLKMPDVEITAICDLYEDRLQLGMDLCKENGNTYVTGYLDHKELLKRDDIEGVVIATNWPTHIRLAIDVMRAGKRPAFEVGGANSLEDCWQLVHASEETGIPCMMLENCCYGKTELALLNMVKQNMFGELINMHGAYGHDLRHEITHGKRNRHYRFPAFRRRNAELYPTHELGPIANMLNINRGNRFVSLVSMASKGRGLAEYAKANFPADSLEANITWNEGDVVTTLIKCANGETITLVHDNSLPRKYSRELRVQGTRGMYNEMGDLIYLEESPYLPEGEDPYKDEMKWDSFTKDYLEKYNHPLWKWYENRGVEGGHGGMDYLVLRAYVESVQEQIDPPIDVYDCAAWMCITALSEESIALGSAPVAIPDFTGGRWMDRDPETKGKYALDAIPGEDQF